MIKLKYLTRNLIIWLDRDKYVPAITAARRAELLGIKTNVIYTEDDPKSCTDDEIINRVRI